MVFGGSHWQPVCMCGMCKMTSDLARSLIVRGVICSDPVIATGVPVLSPTVVPGCHADIVAPTNADLTQCAP